MSQSFYQRARLAYQRPEIRVSTEVILSVFASVFLIMMAVRPTLVTVAELRKKIEDQSLVKTKLDTKIKRLIEAQKQLEENEAVIPLLDRAVPDDYTYANLAKKIEIVALETGVEIESLSFSSAVIVSEDEGKKKSSKDDDHKEWVDGRYKVKEFTIRFVVVAGEQPVLSFLKKMEGLDRVMNITMVDMVSVKKRGSLKKEIQVSGELSGYHLLTTDGL